MILDKKSLEMLKNKDEKITISYKDYLIMNLNSLREFLQYAIDEIEDTKKELNKIKYKKKRKSVGQVVK